MVFYSKSCCIDKHQDISICNQTYEYVYIIDSNSSCSEHISFLKTNYLRFKNYWETKNIIK